MCMHGARRTGRRGGAGGGGAGQGGGADGHAVHLMLGKAQRCESVLAPTPPPSPAPPLRANVRAEGSAMAALIYAGRDARPSARRPATTDRLGA